MPELPEVETVCRGLRAKILNKTIEDVIVHQPQLRWPVPKNLQSLLLGESFTDISRRGKYLLLSTRKGTVIVHLGLSGKLWFLPCAHKKKLHEHITICFADKNSLCLIDPRKFGALLWTDRDPLKHLLLKNIGPEPLSCEFDSAYLLAKVSTHKIAIKLLLMDSRIVAGIGNIYANEALFLAHINPLRSASGLSAKECALLVDAIKQVLKSALEKGGTTIKDFMHSDGQTGYFQQELKVYGRADAFCPNCKSPIKQIRQNGRSTFYCPKCQL